MVTMMRRAIVILLVIGILICQLDKLACQESATVSEDQNDGRDGSPSFEPATSSTTSSSSSDEVKNDIASNSTTSSSKDENLDWGKNQRVQAQQEARRKRKQKEREKDNLLSAKRTLQAANSEDCDWRTQPLAIIRGEVCGSYYKVLGLDRKRGIVDKADVKKAYRQKSLNVHPDKNSSPEANEAFKIVQEAYECLADDECRQSYDRQLSETEQNIHHFRDSIKRQLVSKVMNIASHTHYYVSVAAHHLYQAGLDIWDLAGEIEMNLFGHPHPIGKYGLILALAWKGRFILKFHALMYAIVRINYELAKSQGFF